MKKAEKGEKYQKTIYKSHRNVLYFMQAVALNNVIIAQDVAGIWNPELSQPVRSSK